MCCVPRHGCATESLCAVQVLEGDKVNPGGEMSLQVALTIAMQQLSMIPTYGNREVR